MTKKYIGKDGGRYVYNDDLINIQDTAISAMVALFSQFGNMIISGVEYDQKTKTLSEGYVFLNGYIRKVNKTTFSSNVFGDVFVYEKNTEETVQYKNEQSQVGAIVYGTEVLSERNMSPEYKDKQFIEVFNEAMADDRSLKTLKNLFFGRDCLLKDANGSLRNQTIASNVIFSSATQFNSNIHLKRGMYFKSGGHIDYQSDDLWIYQKYGTAIVIKSNGLIEFVNNKGDVDFQVKNGVVTSKRVNFGEINLDNNGLYVTSGELPINKNQNKTPTGFSLFDGVEKIISYSVGSRVVRFFRKLTAPKVTVKNDTSLIQNEDFESTIDIVDKGDTEVFSVVSKNTKTTISSLKELFLSAPKLNIPETTVYKNKNIGDYFVNSETYTSDKKTFVTKDGDKVLSEVSFSKDQSNKLNAIKTSLISSNDTVGYVTASDAKTNLDNKLSNESKLNDLVLETEDDKREACRNIGAGFADDYQLKQKDTGWLNMLDYASGDMRDLKVRQIGNTVWIAGTINSGRRGDDVFAILPNNIDVPVFDAHVRHSDISKKEGNYGIDVGILKNSNKLVVLEMHGTFSNDIIRINITYLTN